MVPVITRESGLFSLISMYSLGVRSPKGAMRSETLIILFQISKFSCASSKEKNQLAFRHSSLNEPLKLSMNGLSVGFPGLEKSSSYFIFIRPFVQYLANKLTSVIHFDRGGSCPLSKVTCSITCTTSLPFRDFPA